MSRRRKALATLAACLGVAALPAHAQELPAAPAPRLGLGPQWSQSSDSDGLSVHKPGASAYYQWKDGANWHGVELQRQRYTQAGATLEGASVAAVGQAIDPATWLGYGYKLGWNEGPARGTWIADGFWSGALGPRTQWSVFGNRDVVESLRGAQDGVAYTLAGLSLDTRPLERLTVVNSATFTRFSDEQNRRQFKLRAVWDLMPEQGLTLQAQLKAQTGEREAAVRRYFNPGQLEEGLLLLGLRRRLSEGWQFTGRAGAGSQRVDRGASSTMRLTEVQLQSPMRSHQFLRLRLGYSETLGLSGPGYIYRSGDLSWMYNF